MLNLNGRAIPQIVLELCEPCYCITDDVSPVAISTLDLQKYWDSSVAIECLTHARDILDSKSDHKLLT